MSACAAGPRLEASSSNFIAELPVNSPAVDPQTTDARTLAAALTPLLIQACEGSLGDLVWFRTDWQRGGAATGRATLSLRADNGHDQTTRSVIVKLPVVDRELTWTRRLQTDEPDQVAPRLYQSGESLGGYDLAWVVIERFEHGPLALHWHEKHIERIADAIARFSRIACSAAPVGADRQPRSEDWDVLLEQSLASVNVNHVADHRRWGTAIKSLHGRIASVLDLWESRDCHEWVHGDLHPANAMSRIGMNEGPVCLIDFAEVRPGHWLEDAVYFERLLWGRPELMKSAKPVKAIAAARRRLGLPVEDNYARLAAVRRALLAATAPRFMRSEGSPHYLHACLERLESALHEVG